MASSGEEVAPSRPGLLCQSLTCPFWADHCWACKIPGTGTACQPAAQRFRHAHFCVGSRGGGGGGLQDRLRRGSRLGKGSGVEQGPDQSSIASRGWANRGWFSSRESFPSPNLICPSPPKSPGVSQLDLDRPSRLLRRLLLPAPPPPDGRERPLSPPAAPALPPPP